MTATHAELLARLSRSAPASTSAGTSRSAAATRSSSRASSARRRTSSPRTTCAPGRARSSTACAAATPTATCCSPPRRSRARPSTGCSRRRGSRATSPRAASWRWRSRRASTRARIYLHGNAKSEPELREALEAGVGHIVLDSFDDFERLERVAAERGRVQEVLIRVTPDVAGDTHARDLDRPGRLEVRLLGSREAPRGDRARRRRRRTCELVGLHFHIGSQLLDLEPFRDAVAAIAAARRVRRLQPRRRARRRLHRGAASRRRSRTTSTRSSTRRTRSSAPDKRLLLEPGRALVANSTVTLYTVQTVKRNVSTWVAVDGGMSDNLRPMLYGSRLRGGDRRPRRWRRRPSAATSPASTASPAT